MGNAKTFYSDFSKHQISHQTLSVKIEERTYDNLLMISGTGRNTGKTSFACQLINNLSSQNFTAIKISCHLHLQQDSPLLEEEPGKYQIFKERNVLGQKDSIRMLSAGAKEVFYIQAVRDFAFHAFLKIYQEIPRNMPVICESGSLRSYLDPGMHILMKRSAPLPGDKIIGYKPDLTIEMNKEGFSIPPKNFFFDGKKWKVKQEAKLLM